MQKKKLIATYGPLFLVSYAISFIILVTFYSRIKFPTIWGDILIGKGKSVIYIPLGSSFMLALLAVALIEMYRFTKKL